MILNQSKCNYCDENESIGHNYCRSCGYHLTKGYVQSVKVTAVYNINEKFCGYCGKTRKGFREISNGECICR